MADPRLIGRNYTTADLVAKVTGRARYAEDFRAEGMLFCKLLLSPRPHCRVTARRCARGARHARRARHPARQRPAGRRRRPSRDTRTPSSCAPRWRSPTSPSTKASRSSRWPPSTSTPRPRRSIASTSQVEPLPFVVDPLESLRPGGPNARREGNVYVGQEIKTDQVDRRERLRRRAPTGALPMGEAGDTWQYGDLDAGFKSATLVLDETFMTQSSGHMPLETRSAMAYWQNGKLYLHCSTQSVAQTVETAAQWVGIKPEDVVVISEYTGGGFGSKIPGAQSMAIPALLAKKTGKPVMMRISREEELFIGRARPGLLARVKAGFRADGRLTAVDLFIVQDNGPYEKQWDHDSAASICSLAYQPEAMRFRGISVLTNTPPRTYQRSPGGMQQNAIMEPILAKAAKAARHSTRWSSTASTRRRARPRSAPPTTKGQRSYVTSAFVREALDKGAALVRLGRRARRGAASGAGPKVRGVGVSVSPYSGGYSIGYDGLLTIRPDGKLYVQSGIGNHGTHSVMDTARVPAEVLGDAVGARGGGVRQHRRSTCRGPARRTAARPSRR